MASAIRTRQAIYGSVIFRNFSGQHCTFTLMTPHEDGPLYFPTVSTISLGSHTLLHFYRPVEDGPGVGDITEHEDQTSFKSRYMMSLLLEPRSLILVQDDMYKVYLHGIDECSSDTVTDRIANLDSCKDIKVGDVLQRSTRISLTIRHVPKITKAKLFLGRR